MGLNKCQLNKYFPEKFRSSIINKNVINQKLKKNVCPTIENAISKD